MLDSPKPRPAPANRVKFYQVLRTLLLSHSQKACTAEELNELLKKHLQLDGSRFAREMGMTFAQLMHSPNMAPYVDKEEVPAADGKGQPTILYRARGGEGREEQQPMMEHVTFRKKAQESRLLLLVPAIGRGDFAATANEVNVGDVSRMVDVGTNTSQDEGEGAAAELSHQPLPDAASGGMEFHFEADECIAKQLAQLVITAEIGCKYGVDKCQKKNHLPPQQLLTAVSIASMPALAQMPPETSANPPAYYCELCDKRCKKAGGFKKHKTGREHMKKALAAVYINEEKTFYTSSSTEKKLMKMPF